MAKQGKIEHNRKRIRLAERYRSKRDELRKRSVDLRLTPEERLAARMEMSELPRNSNPNRIRNRCELTGRPRGVLRKFKLSRMKFREMALRGEVPGVTKSSW